MVTINQVFLEEVRNSIAAYETEEALDLLLESLTGKVKSKYLNELILQKSRFSGLKTRQRKGLLSEERAEIQMNKLNYAILDLLEELERKNPVIEDVKAAMPSQVGLKEEEGMVHMEKVIGKSNFSKISWLMKGQLAAKSVCQILIGEGGNRGTGTGFLLAGGWLMTNNHIVPNRGVATEIKVAFDFEEDLNGQTKRKFFYELDTTLFRTSESLDYTIVKLRDDQEQPVSSWGYLQPELTFIPEKGEVATIIQHPKGRSKEISFDLITGISKGVLQYQTPTEPGSSGSPVFDSNWKVVALHHGFKDKSWSSKAANQGTLMQVIFEECKDLLT